MKVLLVQPSSRVLNFLAHKGITHPPLAMLYLASMLVKEGIEVKIIDNNIYENWEKTLKEFSPDVLGLSCLTGPAIKNAIEVSKKAKENNENVKVVWGGVHPSLMPEQTLQEEYIDYVVVGEGEETFLELVKAIEKNNDVKIIKGIAYKKGGRTVKTEKRQYIDMNTIPELPYHLINAKRYFKYEACVQTSRGCPYQCTFCYQHAIHECKWRSMQPEKVIEQINRISEIAKVKRVKFVDDNFTVDRKRLFEILDKLDKDLGVYFEVRVNHINTELLEKLKKFRDVQLSIGIESGSQEMLNKLKKGITIEQIKHAFELCRKYKIKTSALGMIGLPGEEKEGVNTTIKFIKNLKPLNYSIGIFIPYPGTPIYDEVVEQGLIVPPKRIIEWAEYDKNLDKINVSKTDTDYLVKMHDHMMYQSVINYLKYERKGIYDKIYTTLDDSISYAKHRILNL